MQLFSEMGLDPDVLQAVEELGFEIPTPVQEKTIPVFLRNSSDIIALAQTGTGKTAAYGLPLIQLTDIKNHHIQSLILCPTRELCLQITSDLMSFARFKPGFGIVPVYGGASINEQIKKIEARPRIIVATPGRAVDLIRRKKLDLNHIEWLILDEADEMLSLGFQEDLETILAETRTDRKTLLFSATMPPVILKIAGQYMRHPVEISVGKKNAGAENVSHEYFLVHAKDRYEALKRIADVNPRIYGIVFCRTRAESKEVADNLIRDGYNADALHGDLSQDQRDIVMNRFRNRHLQLLVATDVAARGLDVNDLSHIINYNLPDDPEIYIHRSGRTGRAGKKGISISILHLKEKGKLRELERMLGKNIEYRPVPSGKDICEKQLFNLIDKVERVDVNADQIEQYMDVIYKKLEWLDRKSLIDRFVSIEFNRFLASYENAPDLNTEERSHKEMSKQERRNYSKEKPANAEYVKGIRNSHKSFHNQAFTFSRLFLNLGKSDRIDKRSILKMINRELQGKSVEIGQIEILQNFSFFEIDRRYESEIRKALNNVPFNGKRIGIEVAKPKSLS